MKLTVDLARELSYKAGKLKTDLELLQFAKENSELVVVLLDDDNSFLAWNYGEDDEVNEICSAFSLPKFKDYHGQNDGVISLFYFIGIKTELC